MRLPKFNLSIRESLKWALGSWLWIWVSAFFLSYIPRIKVISGQVSRQESIYDNLSISERLTQLFLHWDVHKYYELATQNYVAGKESVAFFPGWPYLLSLFTGHGMGFFVLGASMLNLGFLCLAIWVWSRIFSWHKAEFALLLLVFYPTSVFFAAAYPEIAFIALGGLCIWAAEREKRLLLLCALPLFVVIKHAALIVSGCFVAWSFLFRRKLFLFALLGWSLGALIIGLFYYNLSGDPLVWLKSQAAWDRKVTLPFALVFDLRGKSFELVFYLLILFYAPLRLGWKLWKNFESSKKTDLERSSLLFLYTSFLFVPLWFGASVQSLYRIVLLGTPSLIVMDEWRLRLKSRGRAIAIVILVILNLHSTYRFVAGLYLP